jgi:hypothetical protein
MHLSFTNSKCHVHGMTLQTQNLGNQVKVRLTLVLAIHEDIV